MLADRFSCVVWGIDKFTMCFQTSPWQRTETVIQVRELNGLDQFEEDVLAMLTGTAISPVLRAMLTSDMHKHDMASLPIRKLLTVLSPTFQEQIKRRKHFYKSSKLLSKSLVKVS